jgi:hypothetical protein
MALYDIVCRKCGNVMEDVWLKIGDKLPICDECNSDDVYKACQCKHFELKYDPKKDKVGWACHGYSESHYYDEVKKARENGNKNAMPKNL